MGLHHSCMWPVAASMGLFIIATTCKAWLFSNGTRRFYSTDNINSIFWSIKIPWFYQNLKSVVFKVYCWCRWKFAIEIKRQNIMPHSDIIHWLVAHMLGTIKIHKFVFKKPFDILTAVWTYVHVNQNRFINWTAILNAGCPNIGISGCRIGLGPGNKVTIGPVQSIVTRCI